jgi:hypothetical protein
LGDKLTATEFQEKHPELVAALTAGLEKELKDCAWQPDTTTDLWDLPTVDSKTVCKMSPIVESIVGQKLQPSWVRKGGYGSIAEAVAERILVTILARSKPIPSLQNFYFQNG